MTLLNRSVPIRGTFWRGVALAAAMFAGAGSSHADVVKIGIIAPISGAYSEYGKSWMQAIAAFQKLNGDRVGDNTVEIIYRDLADVNPATAKSLAQELVIKDKVQYLGGMFFTIDAVAVAQVAQAAHIPTVIFNAATDTLLQKSDYLLRTSYTMPQVAVPVAEYALEKGAKRVVTLVSDYATGLNAEDNFDRTIVAGGGTVVDNIHVPLSATDFGPFMQTVKQDAPDAFFVFLPGGASFYSLVKAYNENGLKAAGIRFLGTSETSEAELPSMGDSALGLETGMFYAAMHPSEANRAFVGALSDVAPGATVIPADVEAYDGMYVIYKMIAATDGKPDGAKAIAAVKGLEWESPRGPLRIDPDSRQLIQNIYMRVVDKDENGRLYNREFRTFPMQSYDPLPPGAAH